MWKPAQRVSWSRHVCACYAGVCCCCCCCFFRGDLAGSDGGARRADVGDAPAHETLLPLRNDGLRGALLCKRSRDRGPYSHREIESVHSPGVMILSWGCSANLILIVEIVLCAGVPTPPISAPPLFLLWSKRALKMGRRRGAILYFVSPAVLILQPPRLMALCCSRRCVHPYVESAVNWMRLSTVTSEQRHAGSQLCND